MTRHADAAFELHNKQGWWVEGSCVAAISFTLGTRRTLKSLTAGPRSSVTVGYDCNLSNPGNVQRTTTDDDYCGGGSAMLYFVKRPQQTAWKD